MASDCDMHGQYILLRLLLFMQFSCKNIYAIKHFILYQAAKWNKSNNTENGERKERLPYSNFSIARFIVFFKKAPVDDLLYSDPSDYIYK